MQIASIEAKLTYFGLVLILFFLLGNQTGCSESSDSYPDHYKTSALSGEPTIKEKDIKAFIAIRPHLDQTKLREPDYQNYVASLAKSHGLTHRRLYFLRCKLPIITQKVLGYKIREDLTPDYPKNMLVTDEEVNLLKRMWDEFAVADSPRPPNE